MVEGAGRDSFQNRVIFIKGNYVSIFDALYREYDVFVQVHALPSTRLRVDVIKEIVGIHMRAYVR